MLINITELSRFIYLNVILELPKQINKYLYTKTLLNTSCYIYLFVSALTGKQVVIMILIINESVVTQMPQLVIMMTYRFFSTSSMTFVNVRGRLLNVNKTIDDESINNSKSVFPRFTTICFVFALNVKSMF